MQGFGVNIEYLCLSCFKGQRVMLTALGLALGDMVHPVAHTRLPVVGEAGGTLVAGSLTVPARPEHGAVNVVGEDAVEVGAVSGGDRRLWRVTRELVRATHTLLFVSQYISSISVLLRVWVLCVSRGHVRGHACDGTLC